MENFQKYVLLADNNSDFIIELKTVLEKNGLKVIGTAGDGIDAVSECAEKNPDIVFVKKDLGFIDGIKVSFCLREKGFSGLIVIVSEDYSSDDVHKAISAGADGIITKPLTEKFLIPWLFTKFKRTGEKRELFYEKNKLLSELENKRIESEALGIIASSMNVSIPEAKKILEKKAETKGITAAEIAKLIAGASDNQ